MATVSDSQPRPRHTTVATAVVIGASVGVVVTVAEQLAGLQGLDTRERVTDFLSAPPGDALGLDVSTALTALRVVLMLLAGLATAAGVLGYHAMRGSTRARAGLSVLAVPIFIAGFVTGGFLTSLIAAGTALLWVGPSALWFRGEPVPEPSSMASPRPMPVRQPPQAPSSTITAPAPQTTAPPAAPGERPNAVVWACVLTWAFSGITIVVMVASAVLMASNPDLVLDELARQDADLASSDSDMLTDVTFATAAVAGVWSTLAIVLAVLAYRRVSWARWALLVSAAVAAVICLLGTFSSLLMAVPAGATLVTVALLNRPEVRAWFHRT